MRVLVTGAQGYIGAVLVPLLADRGHQVQGLDIGYYSDTKLVPGDAPLTVRKDIRDIQPADLRGMDAIVHLAELSNDPLGQHDRANTFAINHEGSVRLADAARAAGVPRFIYTSSCSVYGAASGEAPKDETSAPNPQTAYAECKVLVERDVGAMAAEDFVPVFLRNATAFGVSPYMRFDIVLNNLAGLAWTTKEIKMISDGSPWRPLVHIRDISKAIAMALTAPAEAVRGEIFNVGSNEQNYRVREIAEIVKEVYPEATISFGDLGGDTRSYRVSFNKIRDHLPGYDCYWDARKGAVELFDAFRRIGMTTEMFNHRAFTRLKQLKHLIETGAIDGQFRRIAVTA